MKTSIKCEACGANLNMNSEKHIKFCPYCGAAIQIPKTVFDHEKEMAELNEQIRKQKVKEERDKERYDNRLLLGFAAVFVLLVFLLIKFA